MQTHRTTTRRRALQLGSIATIAAGLLGTAGTPTTAAAEPAPQTDLATVLCRETRPEDNERYREWLAEWRLENRESYRQREAVTEQIAAYVPADRFHELVNKLDDLSGESFYLDGERQYELLCRHLPGLEPVLRLLRAHIHEVHANQEEECGDGSCRAGF